MCKERKKNKKIQENKVVTDVFGNEYAFKEIVNIINMYKKESLMLIIGDVNIHCNNAFRMSNDGWYARNEKLFKSLTINRDKMKNLLKKEGHEKIAEICKQEGGDLWNHEEYLVINGKSANEFKNYLNKIEIELENNYLTRWCTLRKKSALQLAAERLNIKNDGVTLEELKTFILDAKKKYYNHKKEKYDILNEYYND